MSVDAPPMYPEVRLLPGAVCAATEVGEGTPPQPTSPAPLLTARRSNRGSAVPGGVSRPAVAFFVSPAVPTSVTMSVKVLAISTRYMLAESTSVLCTTEDISCIGSTWPRTFDGGR